MPAPIKISIDIKKLKKSWMKDHTNGATYCELLVYENDEPDKFGNTCAVKQGMPKEARDAGEKAGYCGNGKRLESQGGQRQQPAPRPQQGRPAQKTTAEQRQEFDAMDESEIPF